MDSFSRQKSTRSKISHMVAEQGLHLLAITPVEAEPDFERFSTWLSEKKHGEMDFLKNHLHCRENPENLLPGAKSALILCYRYGRQEVWRQKKPLVAQYARLKDYHRFLRDRAEVVSQQILQEFGSDGQHTTRTLVDSAPILERALAARFSKAFIGKNTMLIHPEIGSYVLLAEILTSVALEHDPPTPQPTKRDPVLGGCGSCRRCQTHCPTGALNTDYQLDANLCLAYWTIEHRGPIPVRFWPWLRYFVFGCDICQSVCPYNRKAEANIDQRLLRLSPHLDLFSVATMNQAQYEAWFGGTPLTRAKINGLRRNALIAMYVTLDPKLIPALESYRQTDSPEVLMQTIAEIKKNPLNLSS